MREWFYKNERFGMGYLVQLLRLRRTPLIFYYFFQKSKRVFENGQKKCPKSKRVHGLLQKTSFVTINEFYGKVTEKITQKT